MLRICSWRARVCGVGVLHGGILPALAEVGGEAVVVAGAAVAGRARRGGVAALRADERVGVEAGGDAHAALAVLERARALRAARAGGVRAVMALARIDARVRGRD